jgi:hypothetical protein
MEAEGSRANQGVAGPTKTEHLSKRLIKSATKSNIRAPAGGKG